MCVLVTGVQTCALPICEAIGLPPYAYQALLTSESRQLADALDFLARARALPQQDALAYPTAASLTLYDPVPLRVVRVANIERAQLLVESTNRRALPIFLSTWSPALAVLARPFRLPVNLSGDPLKKKE